MSFSNAAIDYLLQRGIEYQLIKTKREATEQTLIDEYGLVPERIAQAQLMQDEKGVMLVVTPRSRHPVSTKLQQLLQRQLKPADELLTRQLFHCDDATAIAPLPLTTGTPVVVDTTLRQQPLICFQANDPTLLACVTTQAFMQLHHDSQWAEISEEGATGEAATHTQAASHIGNLQQRLLTLRELPPANDLTRALLDIFADPDTSVAMLAQVIETDASLSAQTLRHARSPYYGYAGEIGSVAEAITNVLGFDTVLMTSLAIASGKGLHIPREGRIGKEALCRHSLYSAVLARSLSRYIPKERGVTSGTAYLTALMQNIGFQVLGHLLKPDYNQLCRTIEAYPDTPLLQLENKTLGINHAQIGTWLMRSWNMPEELTVALRQHHNLLYRGEHAAYVQLTALVNVLLKQHNIGDAPGNPPLEMLLKTLEIPQEKALDAVDDVLKQRDELDQIVISLIG
jgi:HD-like signal output (HDOD) protein/prolyl-tRNA editing enzyme YbaK/EbsC (Cys-tRNA(Pro) deacylase)